MQHFFRFFCTLLLLCICDKGFTLVPKSETVTSQEKSNQEALETIKDFLQALREHDLDRAYYASTTKSFRDATPRPSFQSFIFGNSVLGKNLSAEFQEALPQKNSMIIYKGILSSIDDKKNLVEFALIQEDNKWKILGVKVYPLPQ